MGRPPKVVSRAKSLHDARGAARRILTFWELNPEGRGSEPVSATLFAKRAGLNDKEQGLVSAWFPRVLSSQKPDHWNLRDLQMLMEWDDPVGMATRLAEVEPQTWWGILGDVEGKPYTEGQERVIRTGYVRLKWEECGGHINNQNARNPKKTPEYLLFLENASKRKP